MACVKKTTSGQSIKFGQCQNLYRETRTDMQIPTTPHDHRNQNQNETFSQLYTMCTPQKVQKLLSINTNILDWIN